MRLFVWPGGALFVLAGGHRLDLRVRVRGVTMPFAGWPAVCVRHGAVQLFRAAPHAVRARPDQDAIARVVPPSADAVGLRLDRERAARSRRSRLETDRRQPVSAAAARCRPVLSGVQLAGVWLTLAWRAGHRSAGTGGHSRRRRRAGACRSADRTGSSGTRSISGGC